MSARENFLENESAGDFGSEHARGAFCRLELERRIIEDARGVNHAVNFTKAMVSGFNSFLHFIQTRHIGAADLNLGTERFDSEKLARAMAFRVRSVL